MKRTPFIFLVGQCLVLLGAMGCPMKPTPPVDAGAADPFENEVGRLVARFGGPLQVQDDDLDLRRVRAALRSGRLSMNVAALEACLKQPPIGSEPSPFPFSVFPRGACADLWIPRSVVGDPCDTGLACIDSVCPAKDWPARCAVCSPVRPGGSVGQPCLPCAAGLWCDAQSVCRAPLAAGSSCDGSSQCGTLPCERGRCGWVQAGEPCADPECGPGFFCDSKDGGAPSICLRATLGSPCRWQDQCPTGLLCPVRPGEMSTCQAPQWGANCDQKNDGCGPGLVCADARYGPKCTARVELGAACRRDVQCPAPSRCLEQRCVTPLPPGARCGEPGSACMPGALCVAGRCSRRPKDNEPCVNACASGTCSGGRCQASAVGAACLTHAECGDLGKCEGSSGRCAEIYTGLGAACTNESYCRGYCTDGGVCAAPCVLGDGRARDDFFGAFVEVEGGPERLEDGGCDYSGPPAEVIVLSAEQSACVFGGQPFCVDCHRPSGCEMEARPKSPPVPRPPPWVNSAGLLSSCGIDAGP